MNRFSVFLLGWGIGYLLPVAIGWVEEVLFNKYPCCAEPLTTAGLWEVTALALFIIAAGLAMEVLDDAGR